MDANGAPIVDDLTTGDLDESRSGLLGNPYNFQGRRLDPETGLYHFRNRQYDPTTGSFASIDPSGLWQHGQGNGYSAFAADTWNHLDPLGLNWFTDTLTQASAWTAGVANEVTFGGAEALGDFVHGKNNPSWNEFKNKAGFTAGETCAMATPQGAAKRAAGKGVAKATAALGRAAKKGESTNGAASKGKKVKEIFVDPKKYPESAKHLKEAGATKGPLTVDRTGAKRRRREALRGKDTKKGMDRDESPPAVFKEGSKSVKSIPCGDNRGSGATIGNQLRGVKNGEKAVIKIAPIPKKPK